MGIDKKIEQRLAELSKKIYEEFGINRYATDDKKPGVTRAEAWQMACQQLQIEFAAKQAVAQVSIQFLLSDLLKRSEPLPSEQKSTI